MHLERQTLTLTPSPPSSTTANIAPCNANPLPLPASPLAQIGSIFKIEPIFDQDQKTPCHVGGVFLNKGNNAEISPKKGERGMPILLSPFLGEVFCLNLVIPETTPLSHRHRQTI